MRKKGSIFLSVLLGAGIAIALAIAINYQARLEIKKSYNFRDRCEARLLSRSVIDALSRNPLSIPPYKLQEGRWISVESVDLERYININSIILPDGKTVDVKWRKIFERIFNLNAVSLDLIPRICDFIDGDREPRLGGFEGEGNLNRRLYLIDELLLMNGMNEKLFKGFFSKYFTAISSGKVNLNTAPKEILMALSDEIDEEVADAIIEFRKNHPLRSFSDLKKIPSFPPKIIPDLAQVCCFEGKYFRLRVKVKVGEVILKTEAVVSDGKIIYEREGW